MKDFALKVLTAPLGRTYLFSVGQAGFIIKSKSGQLLGIDLYLSDCVERVEGHVGYKRLLPKILDAGELEFDVLVTTHPHKDHFDDDSIPQLMSSKKTCLYASLECEKDVDRLGLCNKNITYVSPNDTCICGDFKIDFVTCDHGTGAPDAVGVIVSVDGKKLYEVGDSSLRLDRIEEYTAKGPIDVLIAPINGMYGNLDSEECAQLAEAITPGLIVPCHYGMFAAHRGDVGLFLDIMEQKYPQQKYLIMSQGERYTVG